MSKTPITPEPRPGDALKTLDDLALARHLLATVQELVSRDHPKLSQLQGDSFKLLAKLVRAISSLAFEAAKKKLG